VIAVLASLMTAVAVGALGVAMLRLRGRPGMRHRTRTVVEGVDVTPTQFWATIAGVSLAAFLLIYGLTGLVAVAAVPAVVVTTLPKAYYSRARAKRLAAVQEAWPDGIRDILASIRSGASLPVALEQLAIHGPQPLREAFQGFPVYARSLGVAPALEMVRADLADPTSDRIIEVLILAHERGGPVVGEILSDLADAATRDSWAVEQVRTEALEHMINSRVVFVLPGLVLVAMTSRSGAFREFYSTPAGILVVVVGGVMSLVGILIASRLGALPPEPRVFTGGDR
jgi:tight adherence protein B